MTASEHDTAISSMQREQNPVERVVLRLEPNLLLVRG